MLTIRTLTTTLVVAVLAIPALTPPQANAQYIARGPQVGIVIGASNYASGSYGGNFYGGYRPCSSTYGYANSGVIINGGSYYGGNRPYYSGYPTYGYVNR